MQRTEHQERAVTSTASRICVRAGAGSGKTRVLIDRMVHLLESHKVDLDAIAAITFTENAASEMKARLRRACRERAPADDPEALSYWRTLERRVGNARIATIHAFCSGILREHALYLGLDPDFSLLEDADAYLLRDETVEGVVHALLEKEEPFAVNTVRELGYLATIHALHDLLKCRGEAERALSAMPCSGIGDVIAGWRKAEALASGDGVRLLQADVRLRANREELIALGSQCSDASDARERLRLDVLGAIEDMLSKREPADVIEACRRLNTLGARGGSKKKWTSPEAFDRPLMLRNELKAIVAPVVWKEVDLALESKAASLTWDFIQLYRSAASGYQQTKRARISHDFDDLILLAHDVLRDHAEIRGRVARGLKHLLIDEFQDTDGIQLAIARLICDEPGGPSLFVVGDAKQSIYLFRGAEVEVFADAQAAADEVIPLDKNFRSVLDVLAFVNDFFVETGQLSAVEPEYSRLEADRGPIGGARIEFLIPETAEEDKLNDYRIAEARMLAARLQQMAAERVPVESRDGGPGRPAAYSDMTILLRAMSDAHIYERALRDCGVPFTVIAGAGFFERQEVRDLRNLLAYLADPSDEMALLAVLRSPLAALTDESLVEGVGFGGSARRSLSEFFNSGVALSDAAQNACLERARGFMAELRARNELPIPDLVRYILDATGYEAMMLQQDFLGEQRAANARKVLDLADAFSRSRSPTLTQFVRYFEDVARTGIREGEAALQSHGRNAVTVMTVHQAKGLEFPIVAIADASRKPRGGDRTRYALHRRLGIALTVEDEMGEKAEPVAFQCMQQMHTWNEMAEHARLLYVAMTRARDYLLIGGAPNSKESGGTWMAALDAWQGLSDRADGDVISGASWQANVRRRAPVVARVEVETAPSISTPLEWLRRRIEPIPAIGGIESIAATRLAIIIADGASGANHVADRQAIGSGGTVALERGNAAHRLLQLWRFDLDQPPPLDAVLHCVALPTQDRDRLGTELTEMIARFRGGPHFASLRNQQRLQKELAFHWQLNGVTVSGTIDAVLDDGTIVDFKTGARDSSLHARYVWQVRLYAAALHALTGQIAPGGLLCYLDSTESTVETVELGEPVVAETSARALEALTTLMAEPHRIAKMDAVR